MLTKLFNKRTQSILVIRLVVLNKVKTLAVRYAGESVYLNAHLYHTGVIGEDFKRIYLELGDKEITGFYQHPVAKEWTVFIIEENVAQLLESYSILEFQKVVRDICCETYWMCEITSECVKEAVNALRSGEVEDKTCDLKSYYADGDVERICKVTGFSPECF
ncbi:MAG: hypothetical protein GY861_20160 [bacterium]|nr:hypothetical protein [bacterium]